MRHTRLACYGWLCWPRYAHAFAEASPRDTERCADTTFYEHRGRFGRHTSSAFGVRRPLRYLSYQLDLDEGQRRRIAAVLDRLKVEREQAALDEKRAVAGVAELVTRADLTAETIRGVLDARVKSHEALQSTIAETVSQIVAVLDPDQREEFAYLLRTGAFQL